MSMSSLQKIVAVENELHAAEQAEKNKADLWLKDQEKRIFGEQKLRLTELETKKEEIANKAQKGAERRAAVIVEAAERHAEQLAVLSDDFLCRSLQKHLVSIITGNPP